MLREALVVPARPVPPTQRMHRNDHRKDHRVNDNDIDTDIDTDIDKHGLCSIDPTCISG